MSYKYNEFGRGRQFRKRSRLSVVKRCSASIMLGKTAEITTSHELVAA